MEKNTKVRGFSLIELAIVVFVIGVLVATAIPSYRSYVLRGRRVDAIQAILKLHLDEEKYRYNNPAYSSALSIPTTANYTISIFNVSANSYTITATADGDQANDKADSTSCATLTLLVNGNIVNKTPAVCWNNS